MAHHNTFSPVSVKPLMWLRKPMSSASVSRYLPTRLFLSISLSLIIFSVPLSRYFSLSLSVCLSLCLSLSVCLTHTHSPFTSFPVSDYENPHSVHLNLLRAMIPWHNYTCVVFCQHRCLLCICKLLLPWTVRILQSEPGKEEGRRHTGVL